MTANDKRAERRVPVALRIRLRYSDVDQFISKFAINISRGGMFLSSRNPKPVGTHLHFEMRLADDSPVIEGSGEVRWIREYDRHHPSQPHGMGIRFFELKPESQDVLERIIEHRRSVGEPDDDSIPEPRGYQPAVTGPIPAMALPAASEPPPAEPIAAPPPGPPALETDPAEPSPPAVAGALARARRLAAGLVQGGDPIDAELAALLEADAVPAAISVEAASRELAERLGGAPVVRRRPAGAPAASLDDTGSAEKVDPADVLEEVDAAASVDVDLGELGDGDPEEPPADRVTPRAGRGRGRTARG